MRIFKKKSKRFLSPTAELFDSMVGEGMEIYGRIVAHKSVRIDGVIYGNVEIPEGRKNITVAVGSHGKVYGDIKAYRVLVGGYVEGNIYVAERVELHNVANVIGDITYSDIGIEPGAEVMGLLIKRSAQKREMPDAGKLIKKIQDTKN
jgi:cytoskeletal protein CcmA (bactofilin family)